MRKKHQKSINKSCGYDRGQADKQFNHWERTSHAYFEGRTCDLEVSYDALAGKVEAMIYGDDARKAYPNIKS